MYYIVENKHFPEWIKALDGLGFYLTENEDDAMHFTDPDEAEDVRKRIQESTGCIWRVYEINENNEQV